MFEEMAVVFFYATSPVHMGTGTGLGAVDNPIQRERHTEHPMLAGSGLKGAMRHVAGRGEGAIENVPSVFGPDTAGADRHAGALSLSDAQIVLFPVRSLRGSYVYATCPTALARLERLCAIAGLESSWTIAQPAPNDCATPGDDLAEDGKVVLESFAFERDADATEDAAALAQWLAEHALGGAPGSDYFRQKIEKHTVVLHDDRFNHFVRHATIVEPHVRISDTTGSADDGGLFYTESLPPESLLVALAMASRSRGSGSDAEASAVLGSVRNRFDRRVLQVGGDATTGRGQVLVSISGGEA